MTLHEASAVFLIVGAMIFGTSAVAQDRPVEAGSADMLMEYEHLPGDWRFWVVSHFNGPKALTECKKMAAEKNAIAATVPTERWLVFWEIHPPYFACAGADETGIKSRITPKREGS